MNELKETSNINKWEWVAETLKLEQRKSWKQTTNLIRERFFPDEEYEVVFNRVRNYLRKTSEYKKGDKVVLDLKVCTDADIKNYAQILTQLNKAQLFLDRKQKDATVTINEDKPILLTFWGDLHIGSLGVDYEQMDEDIEFMKQVDGLYIIGMGDYKDNANALVHANAVQEDIAPSNMQDMIVSYKLKRLNEKIIILERGCHDDIDKRLANKDFIQELCDEVGAINHWHGGRVSIIIGNEEYTGFVKHKYKGESGLNTTNAQRTALNEKGFFDFVAFAHKHFPEISITPRMGRTTIYIRSGTYKVYDEYGQKLAGYDGLYGVPSMLLYPNEHKLVPFMDLRVAVEALKNARRDSE